MVTYMFSKFSSSDATHSPWLPYPSGDLIYISYISYIGDLSYCGDLGYNGDLIYSSDLGYSGELVYSFLDT